MLGDHLLTDERALVARNEQMKAAAVDELVELRLCQLEGLGALATPAFTEELEVRIPSNRIADLADAQVDLAVEELVCLSPVVLGKREDLSIGTELRALSRCRDRPPRDRQRSLIQKTGYATVQTALPDTDRIPLGAARTGGERRASSFGHVTAGAGPGGRGRAEG